MNGMCPLGFILAESPWFFNQPGRQILRHIGKNFRFFIGKFCKSPNLRQILHDRPCLAHWGLVEKYQTMA